MNFASYIDQAWTDHAKQPEKVASDFASAQSLVESPEQLNQLIGLVTHVMGEHLAKWDEGIRLLQSLHTHAHSAADSDCQKSALRSIAILQVASAPSVVLQSFSPSDQIRIFAGAASALGNRDTSRACKLLNQALGLAKIGLDKTDPANRALAVTGHNLACSLEENTSRTPEQAELMVLAAQTSRIHWELAGTWLEVSRAEYRLAMTYVQAEDLTQAFHHAQICVELCQKNHAGDVDLFYAYEALAVVERARGKDIGFQKALGKMKEHFAKLSPADQSWCDASLSKLL